eukprot:GGOE01019877.1.p1 GENE.GGOE01019877.1~~GGOE01019877.1.p1  ORF type:complete len:961 (-),score=372.64 GGOE01019877.1:230-3016(-)
MEASSGDYEVGEECIASLSRLTSRVKEEIRQAQGVDDGLDPCPRPIYRQLAQLRIVQTDLIPLFIHYRDDWKISSAVLKLLLVLTLPPDDRTYDKAAQSAALHSIREAFLAPDVLTAFVGSLEPLMRKRLQEGALLTARECRYLEMLLTLFTNLLKVPNDNFSSSVSHNRMVWNTLVQQCQVAGVFDALIVIIHTNVARLKRFPDGTDFEPLENGTNAENTGKIERWNLIVLEILVLLYRVEDMEDMAKWSPQATTTSRQQRAVTGKQTLEQLLQAEEEARGKVQGGADLPSNRHTNFGGTLVSARQGRQVICSTETFLHKDGIPESEKPERMQKWMCRVGDPAAQSSSKSKRVLAEFLDRYLADCNKDFMDALFGFLRDKIAAGTGEGKDAAAASQEHEVDIVQFLLWARITLQYTRCTQVGRRELSLRNVADLLTEEMFDVAFLKASDYRLRKLWRPLHVAVALLRELFMALCVLNDNSKQPDVRAGVAKLCCRVMYRKENVDLVFDLMKSFEVHLNTLGYLTDLVQLAHLIVKVIEFVSHEGHIFVKRIRRIPKRQQLQRTEEEEQEADAKFIDDTEAKLAQEGKGKADGAAGDNVDEEEVSGEQMPEDEVAADDALLPAKRRRLVVEDDQDESSASPEGLAPTGSAAEPGGLVDDEEDDALQHIRRSTCEFLKEPAEEGTAELNEFLEDAAEAEAEDFAGQLVEEETSLSFEAYLLGFVHPKVAQAYLELLRSYGTNTPATNHCIAKMVSRIAFTLKMAPVFCHIGFLAVFMEILEERQNKAKHADLYRVAQRMVKEYSRLLKVQPQLVLYSLFWISRYDAMVLANASPSPLPQHTGAPPSAPRAEPQEEADYNFQETPEGGWAAAVAPARGSRGTPNTVERENAALLAMEDDGGAIDYEDIDGLARILARHKRRLMQQPPAEG